MRILLIILSFIFIHDTLLSQAVVKLVNKNKYKEAEEYCESKSCNELNNKFNTVNVYIFFFYPIIKNIIKC